MAISQPFSILPPTINCAFRMSQLCESNSHASRLSSSKHKDFDKLWTTMAGDCQRPKCPNIGHHLPCRLSLKSRLLMAWLHLLRGLAQSIDMNARDFGRKASAHRAFEVQTGRTDLFRMERAGEGERIQRVGRAWDSSGKEVASRQGPILLRLPPPPAGPGRWDP